MQQKHDENVGHFVIWISTGQETEIFKFCERKIG